MKFEAILDKMRSLEKDWDTYGSDPPNEVAIENAKTFLETLESAGMASQRVAPSVVGGVGITFERDGKEVYVEFYNDGDIIGIHEDGTTLFGSELGIYRIQGSPK